MYSKNIVWCGLPAVLVCDGKCNKAWGFSARPKVSLGSDPDDIAYLSDGELGEAPANPGSYEGGCAKPSSPVDMNKWCSRECERSDIAESAEKISLTNWEGRVLNQPWKHAESPTPPAAD